VNDGERSPARKLALLFGVLYFVQGFAEPTEGLIAQPTRSLLRGFGLGADEIAGFMLIVGIPWYLKPLFGLLTDFVPLLGSRRKSWLLLATLMAGIGLLLAGMLELPAGSTTTLLLLLLVPCVGVALADVVADALMVEKGQPLGMTGRLQSVQWAALYGAVVLVGVTGGLLSEHGLQQLGFVICGAFSLIGFVVAWRALDTDPPLASSGREQLQQTLGTIRHGYVLPIAAFLVLLNFNPFSTDVLYFHLTEALGLSESFVGTTYSAGGVAAIVACIAYGALAPRLGARALVHVSLIAMVACSLSYLGLAGERSALVIAAIVAFALMFTTLAQLDLAARYCPPASAGTVFAALMALSNLSLALASRLGGGWYESWAPRVGADAAFERLVLIGAACTAVCWLTLLILPRDPGGATRTQSKA
jgi:predicted MFS family arabinose efflux permease